MNPNALLRRAAGQSLVTALGFAIVAVLLADDAAAVSSAMWQTVAALVGLSAVTFGITGRVGPTER